jgi:hypothetical protein
LFAPFGVPCVHLLGRCPACPPRAGPVALVTSDLARRDIMKAFM